MMPAFQVTAKADIERGPESWGFFAFVFSAFAALGLSLVDELPMTHIHKAGLKLSTFAVLFYVFMLWPWMRNRLIGFLIRLKRIEKG